MTPCTFFDVSSVRLNTARKLARLYSYMFEMAARLASTKKSTAPRSAAGLYLARTSSIWLAVADASASF